MKKRIRTSIYLKIRRLYISIVGVLKLFREIIVPVKSFYLKEKVNGDTFLFVYVGWDKKLANYWLKRFLDSNCEIRVKNKKLFYWNTYNFLHKKEGAIDIAIIDSITKKRISGKYCFSFLLPRWMEMELDIKSSLEKAAVKKIIKSIRKNDFTYEKRLEVSDFNTFYYQMYRPHVSMKHGFSVQIADYNSLFQKFQGDKSELFFLIKQNKSLAAAMVDKKHGNYRLSVSGVKGGDDELIKSNALGALRYFILLHYFKKGIKNILIGSTMPVGFDGVTEYKIRLGAYPYLKDIENRKKYLFILFNTNPFTLKMLKSNPIFYVTGKGLNLAIFLGEDDFKGKDEFFIFLKRLYALNIELIELYCKKNIDEISNWVEEIKIQNIRIFKLE